MMETWPAAIFLLAENPQHHQAVKWEVDLGEPAAIRTLHNTRWESARPNIADGKPANLEYDM